MLTFEWNALRVGDGVLVHDPRDPGLALISGTVLMVETPKGKRSANGVGVRIAAGDAHEVVWPSHLATHRVPAGTSDGCWRCDSLARG